MHSRLRITSLPSMSLLSALLFSALATPADAQDKPGPVAFDVASMALAGTVACNGGSPVAISPVDESTTDVNGTNDAVGSSLGGSACGLPLYAIGSADDATDASDTSSLDDGEGKSTLQSVSLLGGILTFDSKAEDDTCTATGIINNATQVTCQGVSSIQNLHFAGQHITGTYSQPTSFQATNLSIQLPGYCTGAALFNGTLTVANASSQQQANGEDDVQVAPIALKGTLACIGLPLASMQVSLQDLSVLQSSSPYVTTIKVRDLIKID